ncbi:L4BD family NADP-dependent oxidoreductase [Streptomyces sp. 769]|nr:L4BD family NADP-dependent oxidoreductase [Streptomyces sp. 769]
MEVDAFRLIIKAVSLGGYIGTAHPGVEAEWTGRFADWLRSGAIHFPLTRIAGIDRAPQAFHDLIEGQQFGTVVVELSERG